MKYVMKKLRLDIRCQEGMAMATVVMMISVLTLLGVVLIDQVTAESNRSAKSANSDAAYQAAEAGLNDYIAKLTADTQYYDHCVAKGESTRRRNDNNAIVSHSTDTDSCGVGGTSTWTSGVGWTYPDNKDWWYQGTGSATLLRGYAYNLMIAPPVAASVSDPNSGRNYITIVSTGCKVVNPDATPLVCDDRVPKRAIEVYSRYTTPADFQFMMTDMNDSSVCWASTVYGRMYSTGDIRTCGITTYGNMMAEGNVTTVGGYSTPHLMNGARIYDTTHPQIRDVVKDPIPFDMLLPAISDIQRSAVLNTDIRPQGTAFDDATATAWRILFSANGTAQVWKCTAGPNGPPESSPPYCNDVKLNATTNLLSSGSFAVPVNESTNSFPSSGSLYIGPSSGGRTDRVNYTNKTSSSFTGATCQTCSGTSRQHLTGETVSKFAIGSQPGFNPAYNGPIPSNGAIYTAQDAIISWPTAINNGYFSDGSSTLDGRVTVASGGDVIAGGNTHYRQETGNPNDDLLGLIAQNNFWLGRWCPDQLFFRAATMAVTGWWSDEAAKNSTYDYRGDSSSLTFVGTSAYFSNDGYIHGGSGSTERGFNIDHVYRITDDGSANGCPSTAPNCAGFNVLKFLVPPHFPPLGGITTTLFREVPSSFTPTP